MTLLPAEVSCVDRDIFPKLLKQQQIRRQSSGRTCAGDYHHTLASQGIEVSVEQFILLQRRMRHGQPQTNVTN